MKIIAAGRTSSERAALSVACELGIESGGQCCKGQDYHDCVAANSAVSEATIVLTRSRYPQVRTQRYIHRTPSLASSDVMLSDHRSIPVCREWFRRDRVGVLYVTGHVPYSEAKAFLRAILQDVATVQRSAETGS